MISKKDEKLMRNDTRIAVVENTLLNIHSVLLDIRQDSKRLSDKIDTKFDAIDHKFETFDRRFETIDRKFETMEHKFEAKFDIINDRLWSNFLWLMGMIIGLAGLIAHTQQWI